MMPAFDSLKIYNMDNREAHMASADYKSERRIELNANEYGCDSDAFCNRFRARIRQWRNASQTNPAPNNRFYVRNRSHRMAELTQPDEHFVCQTTSDSLLSNRIFCRMLFLLLYNSYSI